MDGLVGAAIEEPELLRRKYSQKERETIPLEDFGDPERRAFPIVEAEDVIHAAERLGEASGDEATIKKRISKIAKRKGFPLPQTWQDEEDGKGKSDRAMPEGNKALNLFLPIIERNDDDWTVTGQATIEDLDAYGTVFDYAASKKAFQQWRGNVREMHDSKKAVGRGIDVQFDDENKRVLVTTRVSRGAKDTWEKIKDGTLTGYSVGAMAGDEDWGTVDRNGKQVPLLKNYRLIELSLVDNPATPGCDIQIVRADGFANGEVVAEDEQTVEANAEPTETRAGAKISHVTQGTLHGLRNNALQQARDTMKLCADDGCTECQAGMAALDPDNDGDIDLIPALDYDGDGGQHTDEHMAQAFGMRQLEPSIQRALQPTLARVNAMLVAMSANASKKPDNSKIEQRLDAIEQRAAGIDEVRSLVAQLGTALSEVRGLTERIANQPQGGGPISNPAAMDKLLAGHSNTGNTASGMNDEAVLQRAQEMGLISSQEAMIRRAALQIQQVRP